MEEYSIDEAFVDLTGLRRSFHGPYESIAEKMRQTIKQELGITVSAGVSLSKVLAKIGSKHKKPDGLTMIPGREIHLYLEKLPVGKVWGIGPNTAAFLNKHGIMTALQFARKDERFIEQHLSKPYREIWHELNGRSVYPVVTETKNDLPVHQQGKDLHPAVPGRGLRLRPGLEEPRERLHQGPALQARGHAAGPVPPEAGLHEQRRGDQAEPAHRLSRGDVRAAAQRLRRGLSSRGTPYRQTGVVLGGLVAEAGTQYSLFEDTAKIEKMARIYECVDELSRKYGKHALQHGASLPAKLQAQHEGERGDVPVRKDNLFKGENKRQRLGLPVLNIKI